MTHDKVCYTKSMEHEGFGRHEASQNDYVFIPTEDMKRRQAERDKNSSPDKTPWDDLRYRDSYGIGIESLSDFEKLDVPKQLERLSFAIEVAYADTWYAVGDGRRFFNDISNSNRFSPLVRIIADCAKSTDPNESAFEELNQFGHDSVIRPGSFYMNKDLESLSEHELESRLNGLEDGSTVIPEIYSDELSYYYDLENELQRRIFDNNQKRLHQEFPALPGDKQLIKIASDAAASVVFLDSDDDDILPICDSLGEISDSTGHTVSMDEEANSLGIDTNSMQYLNAVHRNDIVKQAIEARLGLKLANITLLAQVQLLKFMSEAGDTRFDSLCSVLHDIDNQELRLKFAESFLAADFGDDFGDSLLVIAESSLISDEEKEKILDNISSCRQSIAKITSLYSDFDGGDFAKEYVRAANERLTDAITVFARIATSGSAAADLGRFGQSNLGYNEAIEALQYESKSLGIIAGTFDDVLSGKEGAFAERFMSPDIDHNRSFYNFFSPNHGYVLVHTRPEGAGSFDPTIEYGKYHRASNLNASNVGTEASISIIVDPVSPFSLPSPFRPDHRKVHDKGFYDIRTMNKVSAIRLDREGRIPGKSADSSERNPINEVGTVSVDLAAIGDRPDTPSGKIARLFSVGNKIRSEKRGEPDYSLNHNTNWFNQSRYGTTEGFRKLVNYFDSMAVALCEVAPPNLGEGLTGAKRRARGRKGLRSAA